MWPKPRTLQYYVEEDMQKNKLGKAKRPGHRVLSSLTSRAIIIKVTEHRVNILLVRTNKRNYIFVSAH